MTDALPTQIGKYKIQELVGEGAMGTVYRATDSVLGRTVAVKVMNASIARQPDHRNRFLREAQAAGSLQHPNVVTIYDLGELDGHLFIAMEFVHGTDLERLMVGAEPLKLQSKLDIIVDVLMGLSYAHKHGIIHRDIKPANIRVTDDGHAKIMDFGVAHLHDSDMTRTGLVVGTPSYMAPEQVMGGKAVPGTDLFAVGAVLYHLLSGSKPFEGPTLQSLFYKIVTDMPRPLDEIKPGLPPVLTSILMKALAKEAVQRYDSALDMANAIIAVRAELSGNAYATTASLTASAVEVVETFAPKPTPVAGPAKSFPWKPVGGAAAAAALLLVGWMAFARPSDKSSGTDTPAVVPVEQDSVVSSPVDTTTPAPAPVPPAAVAVTPPAPPTTKDLPPAPTAAEKKRQRLAEERERQRQLERDRELTRLREAARIAAATKAAQKTTTTPAPVQVVPSAPVSQPEVRVAPPPAPPPPPPAAPVREPERPSPREEITSLVAAYARAIESRDLGAVRRAYPGISSDQARGFEQFFSSARNLNVTFRVSEVEVSGNSADARLSGTYQYVGSDGKTERQPVSFTASFRFDGSSWRIASVR